MIKECQWNRQVVVVFDKDMLWQYRDLRREIEELTAEREAMRGRVGGVPDGLPHGTEPGDVTGETALKVVDISERISAKIAELISLRWHIEEAVNRLDNSLERRIIRKHFLEGKTWEMTAEEVNYSERQVYRIFDDIMRKL